MHHLYYQGLRLSPAWVVAPLHPASSAGRNLPLMLMVFVIQIPAGGAYFVNFSDMPEEYLFLGVSTEA
jgi:hypothetical protein